VAAAPEKKNIKKKLKNFKNGAADVTAALCKGV
jgi:hypothetical protein